MLTYLQQIYGQIQDFAAMGGPFSAEIQRLLGVTQNIWQPMYDKFPAKIKELCEKLQSLAAAEEQNMSRENQAVQVSQENLDKEYDALLDEILAEVKKLREQLENIETLPHESKNNRLLWHFFTSFSNIPFYYCDIFWYNVA